MTSLDLKEVAVLLNSVTPQTKLSLAETTHRQFDHVRENDNTFLAHIDRLHALGYLENNDQKYELSTKGRRLLKTEMLSWQLIMNDLLGKFYKAGYVL